MVRATLTVESSGLGNLASVGRIRFTEVTNDSFLPLISMGSVEIETGGEVFSGTQMSSCSGVMVVFWIP